MVPSLQGFPNALEQAAPCSRQSGKGFPAGLLGRNKLGIGRTRDWADRTVSQGSGGRLSETQVSQPPCQGATARL